MARINRRDAPCVDPPLNRQGGSIDQGFQIPFQMGRYPWRPLKDLIGKKAAFARVFLAHLQLAVHIGQDFVQRLAVRVQSAQRRQPAAHQLVQQGNMNFLLSIKVIQNVRLAQPRPVGDLVKRGAAVAVLREDVERGLLDKRTVAPLNTAASASVFYSSFRHDALLDTAPALPDPAQDIPNTIVDRRGTVRNR